MRALLVEGSLLEDDLQAFPLAHSCATNPAEIAASIFLPAWLANLTAEGAEKAAHAPDLPVCQPVLATCSNV